MLERVTGIEPVCSAWKADVLAIVLYPHTKDQRRKHTHFCSVSEELICSKLREFVSHSASSMDGRKAVESRAGECPAVLPWRALSPFRTRCMWAHVGSIRMCTGCEAVRDPAIGWLGTAL